MGSGSSKKAPHIHIGNNEKCTEQMDAKDNTTSAALTPQTMPRKIDKTELSESALTNKKWSDQSFQQSTNVHYSSNSCVSHESHIQDDIWVHSDNDNNINDDDNNNNNNGNNKNDLSLKKVNRIAPSKKPTLLLKRVVSTALSRTDKAERLTLFKINPLTPPSFSLTAARQESSTTPLYRNNEKQNWVHHDNNRNVISEDNALWKCHTQKHDDVDSLLSLTSDVECEEEQLEEEQEEYNEIETKKKKLVQSAKPEVEKIIQQEEEESSENLHSMREQICGFGKYTNTNAFTKKQQEMENNTRLQNKSQSKNNNEYFNMSSPSHVVEKGTDTLHNHLRNEYAKEDDNFVLFPSLQNRHHRLRHSSSLVPSESTSSLTLTDIHNHSGNDDHSNSTNSRRIISNKKNSLNDDSNNNTNNNSTSNSYYNNSTFKSEFPLFFVRPTMPAASSSSSSVPPASHTLDTPLSSETDLRLIHTAGYSSTYLLDPPSLNNYIERHAELLHSAQHASCGKTINSNKEECNNERDILADAVMRETTVEPNLPSVETLLNCSFDSRAFCDLSKHLKITDLFFNGNISNNNSNSNSNSNSKSFNNEDDHNKAISNNVDNIISKGILQDTDEIAASERDKKTFSRNVHSSNAMPDTLREEEEEEEEEKTKNANNSHGEANANNNSEQTTTLAAPKSGNTWTNHTSNALEMVNYLSQFAHEREGKSASVR